MSASQNGPAFSAHEVTKVYRVGEDEERMAPLGPPRRLRSQFLSSDTGAGR